MFCTTFVYFTSLAQAIVTPKPTIIRVCSVRLYVGCPAYTRKWRFRVRNKWHQMHLHVRRPRDAV